MNIKEIMEIIPHRAPFLLVDEIIDMQEGVYAVGKKCVSYNEPFFGGHFPSEPVMPGVLIIEAAAQVGAVCMLCCHELKGKMAYLGSVKEVKFKRKVIPGDVLIIKVNILKRKGNIGVASAIVFVEETVIMSGELIFSVS